MPELHCYKHLRADGGIRYGVSVNYQPVLHRFDSGTTEDDPGLDWYVDIRCLGQSLPTAPDTVRGWLLSNGSNAIKTGLHDAAAAVRQGVPGGSWPYLLDVSDAQTGTFISIMTSAVRRLSNQEIESELMRFHDDWDVVISTLPVFEPDTVEV